MSSHLILSRLRLHDPAFAGRGHHVFDSFQGLSAPTVEDEVNDDDPNADSIRLMSQPGSFRASLAEVKQALAEFPEVKYHPGWIPLSFGGLPERKYRLVHLDVDLYDPTLAALEHFYPRLSRQGVIVRDDYGWPGGARRSKSSARRAEYPSRRPSTSKPCWCGRDCGALGRALTAIRRKPRRIQ